MKINKGIQKIAECKKAEGGRMIINALSLFTAKKLIPLSIIVLPITLVEIWFGDVKPRLWEVMKDDLISSAMGLLEPPDQMTGGFYACSPEYNHTILQFTFRKCPIYPYPEIGFRQDPGLFYRRMKFGWPEHGFIIKEEDWEMVWDDLPSDPVQFGAASVALVTRKFRERVFSRWLEYIKEKYEVSLEDYSYDPKFFERFEDLIHLMHYYKISGLYKNWEHAFNRVFWNLAQAWKAEEAILLAVEEVESEQLVGVIGDIILRHLPNVKHIPDNPDDRYDVSSSYLRGEKQMFYDYVRFAFKKGKPIDYFYLDDIAQLPVNETEGFMTLWHPETYYTRWLLSIIIRYFDDLFSVVRKDPVEFYGQSFVNLTIDSSNFIFNVSKVPEYQNLFLSEIKRYFYFLDISNLFTIPDVAILRGYGVVSAASSELLSTYHEPSSLIEADFDPSMAKDHPVLVIPSGGLIGLDTSPTFKSKLEQYVTNGGTLIVFSQQHGYEYSVLPGGEISGYGWIEDQSCHAASVYINTYHVVLSGQDSVVLDAVVDGYFTRWPKNAMILLERTKNGMPAMFMYNYGKGRVIVSSLYEDWAYGQRARATTWDGMRLIRDIIAWAKDPIKIPEYAPGSEISIPINVTNRANSTSNKVVFTVIDPDKYIVGSTNISISLSPGETKIINFTYVAPSKLGIWWVDYSLLDVNDAVIQNVYDVKRFAVSKYQENPKGFIYRGLKVGFDVTTPAEEVPYGSDVTFYIHIRNYENINKTIRVKKDWNHIIIGEEVVNVPANETTTIMHVIKDATTGRFWAWFYDEEGRRLGFANKGVWAFHPFLSIDIHMAKEYLLGENASITLLLENLKPIRTASNVSVTVLDPKNLKVFGVDFATDLAAFESEVRTIDFMLPLGSEYGVYTVLVEAYVDMKKIGMGTALFDVPRSYFIGLRFDEPLATYRIRQKMTMELEVANIQLPSFESKVEITIPSLSFSDAKNVTLPQGESALFNYTLNLPETLQPGKYDVNITNSFDNSTHSFQFFIPHSKLEFSADGDLRAGGHVSVSLSNVGGVDTTASYEIKLLNGRGFQVNVENGIQTLMAGQTTLIQLQLSDQLVEGTYYLSATATDLETGITETLTATYNIKGLKATFVSGTEKKVYFKGENITATANITSLDGAIRDAILSMRIVSEAPANLTEILSLGGRGPGAFGAPLGVAVDKDGNVYVVDRLNWRVQKFDNDGNFLMEFKHEYYKLQGIVGVALDSEGNVYVSRLIGYVYKFHPNGTLAATWSTMEPGCATVSLTVDDEGYVYIVSARPPYGGNIYKYAADGTRITGWSYGELYWLPWGITYHNGSLYVTDTYKNRVLVLNATTAAYITEWGESGTGYGQFKTPTGICADPGGFIYVSDTGNHRVQKFSLTGTFISVFKDFGRFGSPVGIAIDKNGRVYITDANLDIIQVFSSEGAPINQWGTSTIYDYVFITTDKYGYLHVLDYTTSLAGTGSDAGDAIPPRLYPMRVSKFDGDGRLVARWMVTPKPDVPKWGYPSGIAVDSANKSIYACTHSGMFRDSGYILKFDFDGNLLLQWATAPGPPIAVDSEGYIYAIDRAFMDSLQFASGDVLKYDGTGALVDRWAQPIPPGYTGGSTAVYGITLDPAGFVYTYDDYGYIRKYSCNGTLIANFTTNIGSITHWKYGAGYANLLASDDYGNIYVGDLPDQRIIKFSSDGEVLAKWKVTGMPKSISVDIAGSIYAYLEGADPPVRKFTQVLLGTIWEGRLKLNITDFKAVSVEVEPLPFMGKFWLLSTLYSNTSQVIAESRSSFYITDRDYSLIIETDKRVYKPGENIAISGQVHSYAPAAGAYTLTLRRDEAVIFSETFTLEPNQTYIFTVNIEAEDSFTLTGTVNGLTITDAVRVESPTMNISVIAPDLVGREAFDFVVILENVGNVTADLFVTVEDSSWVLAIPGGETQILKKSMEICQNKTVYVTISGDVSTTIQKDIAFGENVKLTIKTRDVYPEGVINIPYQLENTGLLDSTFNVTFSINNQIIEKTYYLPRGQSITDSLSINLSKGRHVLDYITPYEEGSIIINVAIGPEFIITHVPYNLTFGLNQTAIIQFTVKNVGGMEGEASLSLSMHGILEDTNSTWIKPGMEENITFTILIPDDLEEKSYKASYELAEIKGEFSYYIQRAKISVNASLDKSLYTKDEIAVLTLTVRNERDFNISLFSRVKFNDYDNVTYFNLEGLESRDIAFHIPIKFTGKRYFTASIWSLEEPYT